MPAIQEAGKTVELKGRNLQIQMHGEDVKLLQSRLQQLGYAVQAKESEEQFFGEATEKAVLEFQEKHGLKLAPPKLSIMHSDIKVGQIRITYF